ncbi:MAG: ribonuclease [Kiritimatiellae bacterium]|nr:ribonuclease [Kiritimatiellia bacterium]
MNNRALRILFFLLLAVMIAGKFLGIGIVDAISARLDRIAPPGAAEAVQPAPDAPVAVEEGGRYDDAAHVAAYLVRFGRLPGNYLTKAEARARGWEGGPVGSVAPGCSIGGDHFGNFEGKLPQAKGRKYRECDLEATGKRRGPVRLIWSNDGLFFVTRDHYETFEEWKAP